LKLEELKQTVAEKNAPLLDKVIREITNKDCLSYAPFASRVYAAGEEDNRQRGTSCPWFLRAPQKYAVYAGTHFREWRKMYGTGNALLMTVRNAFASEQGLNTNAGSGSGK
jgi:hypothetical protein